MKYHELIDGIIKEPLGGAHTDPDTTFTIVKKEIKKQLKELKKIETGTLIENRINKFTAMGKYLEK